MLVHEVMTQEATTWLESVDPNDGSPRLTCGAGTTDPVSGCTRWCNDDRTSLARSCEVSTTWSAECGRAAFSLPNSRKVYFEGNLGDLVVDDNGALSGSTTAKLEFYADWLGPTDLTPSRVGCKMSATLTVVAGALSSFRVNCQSFSCTTPSESFSCDNFAYALSNLDCSTGSDDGDDSGGDGDSGDGDTEFAGSCTQTNTGRCQDFTGSGYTSVLVQANCSGGSNSYSEEMCGDVDRLGSCTVNSGDVTEYIIRFYSLSDSLMSAQVACSALSGTWEADAFFTQRLLRWK